MLQVNAEFQRITNKNLPNAFYAELDNITPRLLAVFRQKASKTGKIADGTEIFRAHDEQVCICNFPWNRLTRIR